MSKASLISLIKPIEATKVHARTGRPLGLPEVTVPYGALIEHVGRDHDREKFSYLGEFYTCKLDAYESATRGPRIPPKPAEAAEPLNAPAPQLQWKPVTSSNYTIERAAVPGGWLVTLNGSSMTFVPDAGHQWDGGSLDT
jgi:hypothetical protein